MFNVHVVILYTIYIRSINSSNCIIKYAGDFNWFECIFKFLSRPFHHFIIHRNALGLICSHLFARQNFCAIDDDFIPKSKVSELVNVQCRTAKSYKTQKEMKKNTVNWSLPIEWKVYRILLHTRDYEQFMHDFNWFNIRFGEYIKLLFLSFSCFFLWFWPLGLDSVNTSVPLCIDSSI